MSLKQIFRQHKPLFIILLIYLPLAAAYASLIPLGEAPDEPAHLSYARYIAKNNRLPVTLEQRRKAGYRATWPPLYHLLISIPLDAVGDTPPTSLKSVGDTPRRLIPTNGQTIAAFIHTAEEAWPWRGITLAWHLSRFVSIMLMALAICTTYLIAWRLTRQRYLAAAAAGLHAFIPQVLFVGSVVNDDNLLITLSGFTFLALVVYTQKNAPLRTQHFLLLGALLGLASVAKYNALPLWAIVFVWMVWQAVVCHSEAQPKNLHRDVGEDSSPERSRRDDMEKGPFLQTLTTLFTNLIMLCLGAFLTGGWWFIFIWRNFNQIENQGFVAGSLAALSAGTADASLRQISDGISVSLPTFADWLEWVATLFKSFWGLFGGGSTIQLPGWVYWLLAAISLLALSSLITNHALRITHYAPSSTPKLETNPPPAPYPLLPAFLLTPLFFLPLPIFRFLLSGSIVETAQGRHLFPALPAITLALILGFSHLLEYTAVQSSKPKPQYQKPETRNSYPKGTSSLITHTQRALRHSSFIILLPLFVLMLSLYSLTLIRRSYPPPIPLYTANAPAIEQQLNANLTPEITLIGYELGPQTDGTIPITLLWQANAIPAEDYLINLSLTDTQNQIIGSWIGHPIGGRYPTRAWDDGDMLRDNISIPLLPNLPETQAALTINLLHSQTQPIEPPLTLTSNLPISPSPNPPISPPHLRADGLSLDAPFTYRSTLNVVLPDTTESNLIAPNDQTFSPANSIFGANGSIHHFIVEANWPSGMYQLPITNYQLSIINRPRQFKLPAMQHTLNANFADQITLLGYDLPQNRVEPGDSFPVTLYLQANRTMGQDLIIFNHLLDQNVVQRGGSDRVPQNYYTTLLWVPQEIVIDSYQVTVDADAPPGIYRLDVGLYPADHPAQSLPLVVDDQPIEQNSVAIGPIKVGGPPPDAVVDDITPQNPLNYTFGDQITLLGFDLINAAGTPIQNSKLKTQNLVLSNIEGTKLILYWQVDAIPSADYTAFVHFLDSNGNLIAQADSPPANGSYPTSLWDPGEIIIDPHTVPNLPPGHYVVQVGLYRPDTGERLLIDSGSDSAVTVLEFEFAP